MMSSKIFSTTFAKFLLSSALTSSATSMTSTAFTKSALPKILSFVSQTSQSLALKASCTRYGFLDSRLLVNTVPIRGFHSTGYKLKAENAEVDPKWAENPKLIPNEEWAKRLNPEQYFCTREGGTEPPFSGQYLKHKAEGIYTCVCCGSDLFSSKTKYDSGSGWPSFYAAVDAGEAGGSVIRRKDISHGMVRDEIICKNCNAHLGHVFEDGPEPTKERHCVNSAALKFVPKKL